MILNNTSFVELVVTNILADHVSISGPGPVKRIRAGVVASSTMANLHDEETPDGLFRAHFHKFGSV